MFPKNIISRLEWIFLAIISIIILIYSWWIFRSWLVSLALTIIFIVIYFGVSYGAKKVFHTEEHYQVKQKQLHVSTMTKKKIVKKRIPLHEVKHSNFSKFILGGYVVTRDNKRHLLYFNDKKELVSFEKHLAQHMKPKKVKGKKKTVKRKKSKRKKGKVQNYLKKKIKKGKSKIKKPVRKKVQKKKRKSLQQKMVEIKKNLRSTT